MHTGRLVKLPSTIRWHRNGTTPHSEPAILYQLHTYERGIATIALVMRSSSLA